MENKLIRVEYEEKYFEFIETELVNKIAYKMTYKNKSDVKKGTIIFIDKNEKPLPYKNAIKKFMKIVHSSNKIKFK